MSAASTVSAAAATVAVRFGIETSSSRPAAVDAAPCDHLPPFGGFCQLPDSVTEARKRQAG